MTFDDAVRRFQRHLETEKMRSKETVRAYLADLRDFQVYLQTSGSTDELKNVTKIDQFHARGFLGNRYGKIKKISVGRKLSSIRTFFRFLVRERVLETNPAAALRSPKCDKPLPKAMTVDEIDRFFSRTSERSARDVALFELLYSSGLRVGELTTLRVQEVDLNNGWVRVIGKGNKERYVPVGSRAIEALKDYLPLRATIRALTGEIIPTLIRPTCCTRCSPRPWGALDSSWTTAGSLPRDLERCPLS